MMKLLVARWLFVVVAHSAGRHAAAVLLLLDSLAFWVIAFDMLYEIKRKQDEDKEEGGGWGGVVICGRWRQYLAVITAANAGEKQATGPDDTNERSSVCKQQTVVGSKISL